MTIPQSFIAAAGILLGSAAAAAPAPAPGPAVAAEAAQAQPSEALSRRAADLVRLINGEAEPADLFSPEVLAKIPAARLSAVAAAVRGRYGRALAVGGIDADSANRGQVLITFEQTQLPIGVGVQAAAPNLINALEL